VSGPPSPLVEPAAPAIGRLQRYTPARLGLGRAGAGMPTAAHLQFALDHARARDAVWSTLDRARLVEDLGRAGLCSVFVQSRAETRDVYLRRPDLGRRLRPECLAALAQLEGRGKTVLVVADGLSALAVQSNAAPVAAALRRHLPAQDLLGTVVVVENGRVAVGDEVGELLQVPLVVVLIGERPGLSAADSLGCYITWQPRLGTPDSRRNCVSNIRTAGLPPEQAAARIAWLLQAARSRQLTGVLLKDESAGTAPVLPDGRS
jgi:ethanolamine ammonia-lyase small subunit